MLRSNFEEKRCTFGIEKKHFENKIVHFKGLDALNMQKDF